MKAINAIRFLSRRHRQRDHEQIAADAAGREHRETRDRDRHHKNIDDDEIERKQPRGAAQIALARVLDDGDMELARQANRGRESEPGNGDPQRAVGARQEEVRQFWVRHHARGEIAETAEHAPGDEGADEQERDQLDDGFERDGEDQPVMMLGRLDAARAEQDGEGREQERNAELGIDRGARPVQQRRQRAAGMLGQHRETGRHGFELQRGVRHDADDRDHRDRGGKPLALAVARGDEIGDGGDIVALRQQHDAPHQRPRHREQQDRPDIDRQKIVSRRRRQADAAVIRPRRAIDRKRQGIDDGLGDLATVAAARPLIAVIGDQEQQPDIAQR